MNLNNKTIKLKSSEKSPELNNLQTEPSSMIRNSISISKKIEDKLRKINYKLFQINLKSHKCITSSEKYKKALFSSIIIKNLKKKNIRNLSELNSISDNGKKYLKTTNNHKNFERNKLEKKFFLPRMTFSNFQKNKNKLNKTPIQNRNDIIKLCLIPKYKLYTLKKEHIKNKILSTNNNYIKSKTQKVLIRRPKNILKIGNNSNIESKTEENDMKPKIRFINIKKELLEKTLKINRMFIDFKKQIKDKEKTIRFIGKFKYKKELKNNDEIKNNF